MKELVGAAITVQADRLAIDVDAIMPRLRATVSERVEALRTAAQQVERPALGVVGFDSVDGIRDAAVADVGSIALQQVLAWADSGEATVTIPLRPQSLKAGPLGFAIVPGTAVILDVVVNPGGRIERGRTRGRLEPAFKLPLGASIQGVSLDDNGAVVANLDRFPDVNLSALLLKGFVVPERLSDLVTVLFADRAPGGDGGADGSDEGPGVIDIAGIVVDARQVTPRPIPLVLGTAVTLTTGPETCLDVHYGHGSLRIGGVVDVDHGAIRQAAFDINDISGGCRVAVEFDLVGSRFSLDISELDVRVGHAHVAVGTSEVSVGDLHARGATIHVEGGASAVASTPRFTVRLPDVAGRIVDGRVELTVGATLLPVVLGPGAASGSVVVSERHHQIDLAVTDAALAIVDATVHAGVATVAVVRAEARGSGRVRAASDGTAFSGELTVTVATGDSIIEAAPVHLRSRRGEGTLVLQELAIVDGGLEVLRVAGRLDLELQEGKVPLLGTHLTLAAGATAVVVVDEVVVERPARPRASGSLHIVAAGERCVVDETLLILPPSNAVASVERFVLGEGVLTIHGLRAGISV